MFTVDTISIRIRHRASIIEMCFAPPWWIFVGRMAFTCIPSALKWISVTFWVDYGIRFVIDPKWIELVSPNLRAIFEFCTKKIRTVTKSYLRVSKQCPTLARHYINTNELVLAKSKKSSNVIQKMFFFPLK